MNGGRLLRPATVPSLGAFGRTATGYDGDLLGATVMTVMTDRERGIVVIAMTNITSADTSGVARKVAEAFAR
jgi:hypothetical protein